MACVFCEIVEGRTAAHVVVDDEEFLGFLDIRPLFAASLGALYVGL